METRQPTTWVVESLQKNQVTLKNQEGQLCIKRSQLAENVAIGDTVTADFFRLNDLPKRKQNFARAILEEILKTD